MFKKNKTKDFTGCKFTLTKRNGVFIRGNKIHTCDKHHNPTKKRKLDRDLRELGLQDRGSCKNIVRRCMRDFTPEDRLVSNLPKDTAAEQRISYHRRKNLPANPTSIDFELREDHIPDDLITHDHYYPQHQLRFIMFYTLAMSGLLTNAKEWYADATFKVVPNPPFYQLFSIHAFAKSGETITMVPVIWVLMSSRRKLDYRLVFREILSIFANLKVVQVTCDFEAALWQGLREEFPWVKIKGCLFHFTQAVYRKICAIPGLKRKYSKDIGTKTFCRKLMALPLLPVGAITPTFDRLTEDLNNARLQNLANYMRRQWISGRLFKPKDWCCYEQFVRTTNDVEGWHNRFSIGCNQKSNIPFYSLVDYLKEEAYDIQVTMVNLVLDKVARRQRAETQERQKLLKKLWRKLKNNKIQPTKFLTLLQQHMHPSDTWEISRPFDLEL